MNQLAVLVCLWFIVHCFRHDARENPDASSALWVPLAWMFLAGSRYVSSWLSLGASGASSAYDEGSPIDRAAFIALILVALVILSRRRLYWGQIVACNKLLVLYLFFCLISVSWSDEPSIGFRRWVKDLGNPIMALVILTDPKPLDAVGTLLRRLGYLLLPLSVLFIRHFPELGRDYHADGSPMYTGVGHQKNALGQLCLVVGTYLAWQIYLERDRFIGWARGRRWRLWIMAVMVAWLLHMSNSQTSLATLLVVLSILWLARRGFVMRVPTRLVVVLAGIAAMVASLEAALGLKNQVLELLGRDPSLTKRTDLWTLLFEVADNPMFGSGFMSFWSGERMAMIWNRLGTPVLQAHSGYIEQYLNLGYVGVAFVALLMLNGIAGARALAQSDAGFAHLRLCFVVAAAIYNYTEAAFYGINNMWVLMLCGLITVPRSALRGAPAHDDSDEMPLPQSSTARP